MSSSFQLWRNVLLMSNDHSLLVDRFRSLKLLCPPALFHDAPPALLHGRQIDLIVCFFRREKTAQSRNSVANIVITLVHQLSQCKMCLMLWTGIRRAACMSNEICLVAKWNDGGEQADTMSK